MFLICSTCVIELYRTAASHIVCFTFVPHALYGCAVHNVVRYNPTCERLKGGHVILTYISPMLQDSSYFWKEWSFQSFKIYFCLNTWIFTIYKRATLCYVSSITPYNKNTSKPTTFLIIQLWLLNHDHPRNTYWSLSSVMIIKWRSRFWGVCLCLQDQVDEP